MLNLNKIVKIIKTTVPAVVVLASTNMFAMDNELNVKKENIISLEQRRELDQDADKRFLEKHYPDMQIVNERTLKKEFVDHTWKGMTGTTLTVCSIVAINYWCPNFIKIVAIPVVSFLGFSITFKSFDTFDEIYKREFAIAALEAEEAKKNK